MMTKLLKTYKIYGTDNTVMVNPSENRLKLNIRQRDKQVEKMND